MTSTSGRMTPVTHVILIALTATVVWAYGPTWASLIDTWQSDPDYNHGFLVIPISLWLLWQRRDSLEKIELRSSWFGVGFLLLAGLLRWAGAEFFFGQFEAWSIPVWIAGCVLLFGGWQLLRWSAGAIAFLWFMTPLPGSLTNVVTLPLQEVSATLSTWTLHLFGQPAVQQGTTIVLREQTLDVERACSGLRICYGTLAVAVAFSVLVRPKWPKVLLLLLTSVPVAIVANSFRVTMTGLLFEVVSGEKAHEYAHDFAGILMLPLSLFLLWLVYILTEKLISAFQKSSQSAGLFLLKTAVPAAVVFAGLAWWQSVQADSAIQSLLTSAARHEQQAEKLEGEDFEAAVSEWISAARYLDQYCRVKDDDAEFAARLAKAAERLAFNPRALARARRLALQAWELDKANTELAMDSIRMAMEEDEHRVAIEICDSVLKELDDTDPAQKEIFTFRLFAALEDAQTESPGRVTWSEVEELLREGLEREIEPIFCTIQLALLYTDHLVDQPRGRGGALLTPVEASEGLFIRLLSRDVDNELAWYARFSFRGDHPLPAETDMAHIAQKSDINTALEGDILSADPDLDLDNAIRLAEGSSDERAAVVWLAAATREIKRRELESAAAYYRKAIELTPDDYRPYVAYARLMTDDGADDTASDDERSAARANAIQLLQGASARDALSGEVLLQIELCRQQWYSGLPEHLADADRRASELRQRFRLLRPDVATVLKLNLALTEAEALASADDFARAAEVLDGQLNDSELDIDSGRVLLSRAWLALGGYQERLGLTAKAKESFDRGLAAESESVYSKSYLAFQALQTNQFDRAAELFGDISNSLGEHSDSLIGVIRARLNSESLRPEAFRSMEDIAVAIQQARRSGARGVEIELLEAEFLDLSGDRQKAIEHLEALDARFHGEARVTAQLALAAERSGDSARADQAVLQFDEFSDSPVESAVLKARVLEIRGEWENAIAVLSSAMELTPELDAKNELLVQQVRIDQERNQGRGSETLIRKLADSYSEEFAPQQLLLEQMWAQNELGVVETMETDLKKRFPDEIQYLTRVEARRLLRLAENAPSLDTQTAMLEEVESLISSVDVTEESRLEVAQLKGRLAMLRRQYDQAAQVYGAEWKARREPLSLGIEYLLALNSAGFIQQRQDLLEELTLFLPTSPGLFDVVYGIAPETLLSNPALVESLAESWCETQGDAASWLRLARVLQMPEIASLQSDDDVRLSRVDEAYQKSLEADPANPQNWGEMLRYYLNVRGSTADTILGIDRMLRDSNLSELEGTFVAAQILTEMNLAAQAARFWHRGVLLADQRENLSAATKMRLFAAQFFARRKPETAKRLLKEVLAVSPESPEALRLIVAILVTSEDLDSVREASAYIETTLKSQRQITDTDRRVAARFHYRRAELFPEQFDPQQALETADRLLNELSQITEADAVLAAQISSLRGNKDACLRTLAEIARRRTADPRSLAAFVRFWQDEFAEQNTMRRESEAAINRLIAMENTQVLALELITRPETLTDSELRRELTVFLNKVDREFTDPQGRLGVFQGAFEFLLGKGWSKHGVALLQAVRDEPYYPDVLTGAVAASVATGGDSAFDTELGSQLEELARMKLNPNLHRIAADFYFLRGLLDQAESTYRRCLVSAPDDIGVLNNLVIVVVEGDQNFEEATKLLAQEKTAAADDSEVQAFLLDTEAWLALQRNESQLAYDLARNVTGSAFADAAAFVHLAAAADALGKKAESESALRTARGMILSEEQLPFMDRRIMEELSSRLLGSRIPQKQAVVLTRGGNTDPIASRDLRL